MGREATVTYKRLASLIAEKHDKPLLNCNGLDSLSSLVLTAEILTVVGAGQSPGIA